MNHGHSLMSPLLILCLALVPPYTVKARIPGVVEEPAGYIGGARVSVLTYPSDGLRVKGLLFLPSTSGKLPLILFNHDGVSGISSEHMRASARLAQAGYAVFAPSYRGEDGSEGNIEVAAGEVRDVLNAIPPLSQVSSIDGRKVAMVGVSHGALISVLAAAQEHEIDAVAIADGVMDIYGWWCYLRKTGRLGHDDLTLRTYGNGPEHSPLRFSSRHALARAPDLKAPILILKGGRDDIVPLEQAITFKSELDRSGVRAILKIYPHCRHGSLVYVPYTADGASPAERAETERAWRDLLNFLNAHLKSPKRH
jgi:dipeptidyl aminopeptidase/acylaminoacyl peptidase